MKVVVTKVVGFEGVQNVNVISNEFGLWVRKEECHLNGEDITVHYAIELIVLTSDYEHKYHVSLHQITLDYIPEATLESCLRCASIDLDAECYEQADDDELDLYRVEAVVSSTSQYIVKQFRGDNYRQLLSEASSYCGLHSLMSLR